MDNYGYWNARAEYEDGPEVDVCIEESPWKTENEDQQAIEEWLIGLRPGCTWYSVDWVCE